MPDPIKNKMQPVPEARTSNFSGGKPLSIAIVDTETLQHWQYDVLTEPHTSHLKPSQQEHYYALKMEGHQPLVSKSDVKYGGLALLNKAGEAVSLTKETLENAVLVASGKPIEIKALTPLDEARAKPKPVRTVVVLATDDEKHKDRFHQHRAFIGDMQQGGIFLLDTMQEADGTTRTHKPAVPIHMNVEPLELVRQLQAWEKSITRMSLPVSEMKEGYRTGVYDPPLTPTRLPPVGPTERNR